MRSAGVSTSRPVAEDRDHGPTIGEVLASAATALTPASSSPRLDAEVLLAHVLEVDRARLVLDRDLPLGGHTHELFDRLARRRLRGEPIAYLTGRRWFRFLELDVDPRVLIPRPETEGLVEVGLALPTGTSVLDVGTGSGAVALALKHERPDLRVSGVDVSAEAVAVAELNGTRLNLNVSFRVGDLLENAACCDAVLANLPYVERGAELPVDVADFEPPLALFGGPDGLDVIRRLLAMVAAESWPGLLALEIGETQGETVAALVDGAGFGHVEVRQDLTGRDRVVVGRR
jgi:release factor glutamine methyltransferase